MNRTNYILVGGLVLLLVAAGVAGQLEFRRTHPAPPAGVALTPGGAAGAETGAPGAGTAPSAADVDQGPGPNDGKPFPTQLNGLPRTSYVTGPEAVAEVSKLHGKDIRVASAEIAAYGSGKEKVMIWVTVSASKSEAQALLGQMLARMEQSSAFSKPELLSIKNKAYFSTTGNGSHNYFYLRGTRIYWVSLQVPVDKIMGVMSFVVNQL